MDLLNGFIVFLKNAHFFLSLNLIITKYLKQKLISIN